MITKLITLISCVGAVLLNAPIEKEIHIDYLDQNDSPLRQRNYQRSEYLNSYTEVVYKYETNEVNSVDDLIEGNIYEIQLSASLPSGNLFKATTFRGFRYSDEQLVLELDSNSPYELSLYHASSFSVSIIENGSYINNYQLGGSSLIFVFKENQLLTDNDCQYISSCDYNEIESVSYIQPTTFLGYINEFLEDYLYRDLPLVNALTFEVGGQQVNLLTWLILITGLGLCILFIVIITKVIIWLVKIFSNGLLLK